MTTTATSSASSPTVVSRAAHAGLWLLPVHAALLALGTVTHQPDPDADFGAYARYVTTDVFLASHLGASILGAALGLLGVLAALPFLVRGPSARPAVLAAVLLVVGNVLTTAVFGAAAFAQPAIGDAYLRGTTGAVEIDGGVYGLPLVVTAVVGMLLFVAGSVSLGTAIARVDPGLRPAGMLYAAGMTAFIVPGFVLGPVQPVAALVATGAAVLVARRLGSAPGGVHLPA